VRRYISVVSIKSLTLTFCIFAPTCQNLVELSVN
jgi:hypothetical protein